MLITEVWSFIKCKLLDGQSISFETSRFYPITPSYFKSNCHTVASRETGYEPSGMLDASAPISVSCPLNRILHNTVASYARTSTPPARPPFTTTNTLNILKRCNSRPPYRPTHCWDRQDNLTVTGTVQSECRGVMGGDNYSTIVHPGWVIMIAISLHHRHC